MAVRFGAIVALLAYLWGHLWTAGMILQRLSKVAKTGYFRVQVELRLLSGTSSMGEPTMIGRPGCESAKDSRAKS